MAGEAHAFAHGVDGKRVVGEFCAHHLGDPLEPALRRVRDGRQFERGAVGAGQREAHGREGDRDALDDVADGGCLGAFALHEFEPRRRRRRTGRAPRPACRDWRRPAARRRRVPPRRAISAPHPAPAVRERIVSRATEPIDGSASPRKPSERMSWMSFDELRGAVAGDRQRQLARPDAGAVVADADEAKPAAGRHDLDPRGAGVERVLDQFLDHARRALDRLRRRRSG